MISIIDSGFFHGIKFQSWSPLQKIKIKIDSGQKQRKQSNFNISKKLSLRFHCFCPMLFVHLWFSSGNKVMMSFCLETKV